MNNASILIIHLNGEKIIKNCLSSINKNTSGIKVYVLLNGTADNSEKIIKTEFPETVIYKSEKIMGFAEASNFLAKKADSKYLVFLNNDTVVGKNWLREMIRTMESHRDCIACQPKVKSYYQRHKFEYAGAAGGFLDKYGYPFCRGRIFDSIEEDRGQYDNELRIFWGCGVCLLVKRDFFLSSGMFDEDFFMYAEEIDFCWRANIYGKQILYCPKSEIYHIGSYTIKAEKKNFKKDYLITRNHLLILFKNYSSASLLRILPFRFCLELISAVRFFPLKSLSFIRALSALPFVYFFRFSKKRRIIQKKRKISDEELKKLMIQNSIVMDYFLKNKKTFRELDFIN